MQPRPSGNIPDAYKWSLETVNALRAGDFSRIDIDDLINEIESISNGLKRELVSILTDAIEAILWKDYRVGGDNEDKPELHLNCARAELQVILHSNPTIKQALPESIEKAYQRAKAHVVEDFNIPLPYDCPIPFERIIGGPVVDENISRIHNRDGENR